MNNFEIKSDTKILTLSRKFLIFQTKKQPLFFLRLEADFFLDLMDICNKFVEIKFSAGRMVWA